MDASWFDSTVVSEKHYNGVFRKAVPLQPSEDFTDGFVHPRNGIEVSGPFRANHRMIGIIGRWIDLFGSGNLLMLPFSFPFDTGLPPGVAVINIVLALEGVHLSEERLVSLELLPFPPIIEFAFVDEVKIKLAGTDLLPVHGLEVGRVISDVPEAVSDRSHPFGQSIIVFPMRTHVVRIGGGLIHAHKEGASTGGANRRS